MLPFVRDRHSAEERRGLAVHVHKFLSQELGKRPGCSPAPSPIYQSFSFMLSAFSLGNTCLYQSEVTTIASHNFLRKPHSFRFNAGSMIHCKLICVWRESGIEGHFPLAFVHFSQTACQRHFSFSH